MEKLLQEHGKQIREALQRAAPNQVGKVWSNDNYRVDIGHDHKPNTKNWDLQVNREASDAAKSLIKGGRVLRLELN